MDRTRLRESMQNKSEPFTSTFKFAQTKSVLKESDRTGKDQLTTDLYLKII